MKQQMCGILGRWPLLTMCLVNVSGSRNSRKKRSKKKNRHAKTGLCMACTASRQKTWLTLRNLTNGWRKLGWKKARASSGMSLKHKINRDWGLLQQGRPRWWTLSTLTVNVESVVNLTSVFRLWYEARVTRETNTRKLDKKRPQIWFKPRTILQRDDSVNYCMASFFPLFNIETISSLTVISHDLPDLLLELWPEFLHLISLQSCVFTHALNRLFNCWVTSCGISYNAHD